MHKMLEEIYKQRSDYIILGLTGKTGSGCTTAANILSSTKEELELPDVALDDESDDNKLKKNIIVKHYNHNWQKFTTITVRDVITTFILEYTLADVIRFLTCDSDMKARLLKIEADYNAYREMNAAFLKIIDDRKYLDSDKSTQVHQYIVNDLPSFSKKIKDGLGGESFRSFSKAFQIFGDNIRRSGKALGEESDVKHIYAIAERINGILKWLKTYNSTIGFKNYFVIDAFRNPFEALFFKERFSAFYLIAVKTPEEDRCDRLIKVLELKHTQIIELDEKENPKGSMISSKEIFVSQNISACIQKSDIHINNRGKTENRNLNELKGKLVTYVSLIQHPGVITPQKEEKLMQIAYTAKLNSGCISRQVGAVVTNSAGAIVSIGWNDAPQGQTQCLLRNMRSVIKQDNKKSYSNYERNDDQFISNVRSRLNNLPDVKLLKGRNLSFCFKDVHNEVKGKDNQVHTRALHAEENAFLQLVKHGGQAVAGGYLYSTASPCELCSKKAYQLGISKIVYVEPYPGIAVSHVICSGVAQPKMELFSGAIGLAYHKRYEPILPFKDELGIFFKDQEKKEQSPMPEDYLTA